MIPLPKAKIELAAARDSNGQALNSVYYDARRKRLVAADGYVIAVHSVSGTPTSESGMVSIEHVAIERKLARKKKEQPAISLSDGHVQLAGANLSGIQVEGKFPDYQKILEDAHEPDDEGTVTIGLDVKKLYRLAQALQAERRGSLNVTVTIVTGESQVSGKSMTVRPIDCGKEDGPVGLLMPLCLAGVKEGIERL